MTITEESRHHLVSKAQEVLGTEAAMTLAEHLPPGGWADVATRHDLDALEIRMDLRFDVIGERFKGLDPKFDSIDERFTHADERFDERFKSLDLRFDALDERLSHVDGRFGERFKSLDLRFDALDERFRNVDGRFDERFKGQDFKMEAMEHRLTGVIYQSATAQTRAFIMALISTLIAFSGIGLAAVQLALR